MDCLFVAINARYSHTNNAVRLLHANSAFSTDFIEYTIKDSPKRIAADILLKKPAVVGFSVYVWNVTHVVDLCKRLSREGIACILGGPEVAYDTNHYLQESGALLIVKGEGEAFIDDIISAALERNIPKTLENVAFMTSTGIVENAVRVHPDLDALKSPHRFKCDEKARKHKIAYIEASRGCPFRCSFCVSSLERSVRFFNADKVLDDIAHLLATGARVVKFLDRTFNVHPEAEKIVDTLLKRHCGDATFQFEITGDILERSLLERIHENAPKGMFRFEVGIQTLREETNRLVDRHQDNTRLLATLQDIVEKDIIDLHLDLIAGLPQEDLSSFKETFDTVYRLGAKELQLGFLKLLRGTKIRKEADIYGIRFKDAPPYEIIESDALSIEDIKRLKAVETALDIFHNAGHFDAAFIDWIRRARSPFVRFERLHGTLVAANVPLPAYQIIDIYQCAARILDEEKATSKVKDALAIAYAMRAKTKPKPYGETLVKAKRHQVFATLARKTPYTEQDFHKHGFAFAISTGVFVALYEDFKARGFLCEDDGRISVHENGSR